MVPWFGFGKFIEGVLGEDGVEVAEVRRKVSLVIRRLGILSESLRESLGDRSGCSNVFRLREESHHPNPIAFF